MAINQISFGKSVRINASSIDSERILDAVSGQKPYKISQEAQEQIFDIFTKSSSPEEETALLTLPYENEDRTYILTGDEAKIANERHHKCGYDLCIARRYPYKSFQAIKEAILDSYTKDVKSLIEDTEEPYTVNLEKNGDVITGIKLDTNI